MSLGQRIPRKMYAYGTTEEEKIERAISKSHNIGLHSLMVGEKRNKKVCACIPSRARALPSGEEFTLSWIMPVGSTPKTAFCFKI